MKLTEQIVGSLTPGGAVRLRVQDDGQRGLYLVVGRATKVWFFKRRNRWIKLGSWPSLPVAAARALALQNLAHDEGQRPMGLTLRFAYDLWRKQPINRAPLTLRNAEQIFTKHFGLWADRHLDRISRADVVERHAQIVKASGPMAARNAIIAFKTWWGQAKRLDPSLGDSPTVAVNVHPQPGKDRSVLWERLADWHSSLAVIRSPLRREFYLLALFTGLRRDSLRTLQWDHVRGDTLLVAAPKRHRNRPVTPYTIPLGTTSLDILDRLRRAHALLAPRSPYVFPGERAAYITDLTLTTAESKEWRGPRFTPHDLRACFITACAAAELHPWAISRLVNHRIQGTAEHYVARNLGGDMERVDSLIRDRLGLPPLAA